MNALPRTAQAYFQQYTGRKFWAPQQKCFQFALDLVRSHWRDDLLWSVMVQGHPSIITYRLYMLRGEGGDGVGTACSTCAQRLQFLGTHRSA